MLSLPLSSCSRHCSSSLSPRTPSTHASAFPVTATYASSASISASAWAASSHGKVGAPISSATSCKALCISFTRNHSTKWGGRRTITRGLETSWATEVATTLCARPCKRSCATKRSQNDAGPPTTLPTCHSPESSCASVSSRCARAVGTKMYSSLPSNCAFGSVYTVVPLGETVATTTCVVASQPGTVQCAGSIRILKSLNPRTTVPPVRSSSCRRLACHASRDSWPARIRRGGGSARSRSSGSSTPLCLWKVLALMRRTPATPTMP